MKPLVEVMVCLQEKCAAQFLPPKKCGEKHKNLPQRLCSPKMLLFLSHQ